MALLQINQVEGLSNFDTKYMKGGYRSVPTMKELNAITASHREEGMLVYVNKTGDTYRLVSDNDGLLYFRKESYTSSGTVDEDASDEEIDAILNS